MARPSRPEGAGPGTWEGAVRPAAGPRPGKVRAITTRELQLALAAPSDSKNLGKKSKCGKELGFHTW